MEYIMFFSLVKVIFKKPPNFSLKPGVCPDVFDWGGPSDLCRGGMKQGHTHTHIDIGIAIIFHFSYLL